MQLLKPQLPSLAHSLVLKRPALPTLATLARYVIIQKLEKIQHGQLILKFPDGQELRLGSGPQSAVELRIVSDQFWTRVLLYADVVCYHV